MGYWDATDEILAANGGKNPICSACGKEMFPIDDHGRFSCGCLGIMDLISGNRLSISRIPQVETTKMTNSQKAGIPSINRLHSAPTKAEVEYLSLLHNALHNPDVYGSPEYLAALEALDKERGRKPE